MKSPRLLLLALLCTTIAWAEPSDSVLEYIEASWDTLSRGLSQLDQAAVDPKLGERKVWPVYVAPGEYDQVKQRLARELDPEKLARIELRPLPEGPLEVHGLLYLPHPYVVPGGRFNEMYGWDSYFINLGLLRAGRIEQARQMVDNHLYQVRYYGQVLNANRTYYLQRSQPPFLATMVGDVYRYTADREWLRQAMPMLEKTYALWTSPPHLVPETGLSRYFSLGEGPAPEVLSGERDPDGRNHYDKIREAYRDLEADPGYDLSLYYDRAKDELTPLFYKGDRSMRESGYDPSDRFGRFNIDVIHYLPVDLNCLLYSYELEMARLESELGGDGRIWLDRAAQRRAKIMEYNWDPTAGQFFDYNFRTGKRRNYPFATTFFPLWTGLVEPAVAARVKANLPLFERPGGVVTSTYSSGNQWDAPFGWAPLQMVAVQGLRRYGYDQDADRLTLAFLSLVMEEFEKSKTIVEKYDVVERSASVSKGIAYGYSSNEIGFGWTNAVFLELLDELPPKLRQKLFRDQLL
ncbi:MAG: trehalase family glycosidase [Vulcanimicrobiota bacterium]